MILSLLLEQDLDCYIPPELMILRPANLPHAAFSQLIGNFIMRESFSDHGHCIPPGKSCFHAAWLRLVNLEANYRPMRRMEEGKFFACRNSNFNPNNGILAITAMSPPSIEPSNRRYETCVCYSALHSRQNPLTHS
jgi:hypothetical protein